MGGATMKDIKEMNLAELANALQRYEFDMLNDQVASRLRELHEHQEKINKFIRGEGDINGYYFGEIPPNAPPFWWRKHLMTPTPENKP
jgi:hypothetical protein